jgi:nitroimidazol reductase NimA-like FMN-containing flavoprotein (pyridoxamine 5'-phosphate oxidase superfamily)
MPVHARPVVEELDEAECQRLISPGGIGRIAYTGRYDLVILPVNYQWSDGAILFRTAVDGITGTDLRTGIPEADYKVAFEVDEVDERAREGWSVLIQGPAHHLDDAAGQAAARSAGVHPWAGEDRDHYIRITPTRITGRRVRQAI